MADPAPNVAETAESPMTEAKPESTELAAEQPPSAEKLRKIEDYIVLDKEGNKHTFKSLYAGPESTACVLVIFIRHFFCGVGFSCPFLVYLYTQTDAHRNRAAKSSFVHLRNR
jgi:hypothetical protein